MRRPLVRIAWRLQQWLPYFVLIGAMAVFFAVSFSLALTRVLGLISTNWDLGIFQQALWTGAHGGTFYESGDFEVAGVPSLLIVHPAFLLFAIAPIYAAVPVPTTLLALQSGVLAAAAVPLYLLARRVLGGAWLALAPVFGYLVWAPLLGGSLYDFHLEAFLPIELFSLFLLWRSGRYAAGFAVAGVTFVTLEIAPLLVLFVALYFLIPSPSNRGRRAALAAGVGGLRSRTVDRLRALGRAVRSPGAVRASLALIGLSIAAYGLLRFAEWTAIPAWLGGHPLYPSNGVLGYFVGLGPAQAGIPPALPQLSLPLSARLRNWAFMYALFGFVPLLAPRTQVLQIPWFTFTMLQAKYPFTEPGFQYDLIALAPLAIGFLFGLRTIREWVDRRSAAPAPPPEATGDAPLRRLRSRGGSPSPAAFVTVALVGVLVVTNLAVNPLGPDRAVLGHVGPGYHYAIPVPAGYPDLARLAKLVPSGATVAATNDLFDFVANSRRAFVFLPLPAQGAGSLPGFSPSRLPSFALLTAGLYWTVPPWLRPILYQPSAYTVWGVVWETQNGMALLFGPPGSPRPTQFFGPSPSLPEVHNASQLSVGPSGERVSVPAALGGEVIRSIPGKAGACWYGPYAALPAGRYVAELRLLVLPINPRAPPGATTPAVHVDYLAFGNALVGSVGLTFAQAGLGHWAWVALPFTLDAPAFHVEFQGWSVLNSGTYLEIASLVLVVASP